MRSVNIDWSDSQIYEDEDVNTACPFCNGEKQIDFELWKDLVLNRHSQDWDRYEDVREELNADYKEYVADYIEGGEEDELLDFHDWLEIIMWGANMEGNSVYENSYRCGHCESGYIHPVMNYAYPVDCEFTEKNRRVALECGLFLFKYHRDVFMSLTGGGMDLSPNILLAYLRLTGSIPVEWVTEFQQDYRAYLSEEEHMEIAIACRKTIENEIKSLEHKRKAIGLFIDKPDELERKLKERDDKFNNTLNQLSEVDEPMIRGVGAIAALCNYSKDVI